jgi:hypothetical protein
MWMNVALVATVMCMPRVQTSLGDMIASASLDSQEMEHTVKVCI